MKQNKLILATFIFVMTFILYYIFLYFINAAFIEKDSFLVLLLPLIPSTYFSQLFYKQSIDRFSFILFIIVTFFVSFVTFKVAFYYLFLKLFIFMIPTAFFVNFGSFIYIMINLLGLVFGFYLAWLFYKLDRDLQANKKLKK